MPDSRPLALVADGDSDLRCDLFRTLEEAGFDVATCETAFGALRYVSRCRPGLLIADDRLGDMSWPALVDSVHLVSPRTRMIVLSRDADWGMYLELLRRGGSDLLQKPLRREELVRSVASPAGSSEDPPGPGTGGGP